MSLLPPDGDLELIHTRTYETKVYFVAEDRILVRGAVSDLKPPSLYVSDDPDPLEIHQMQVELEVEIPGLEITDAAVVFETHPNESCPTITEHYRNLIGLQIARGFTHEVRELFGGPRGCTHTTALLQAMAPAAVQSLWSLSMRVRQDGDGPANQDRVRGQFGGNINTCHVWEEDGVHVALLRRGELPEAPLPIRQRLVALGRDPDSWRGSG